VTSTSSPQPLELPDEIAGEQVVLRPLRREDGPRLREIHQTPGVSRWWGPPDDEFPFYDEPETQRLAITAGQSVIGLIQFTEELYPDGRNAEIDIFIDPEFHARGLGADAMRTLIRYLQDERGHHRIILYTSPRNERAIKSYEAVGFRRVGIVEASARDPNTGEWVDELFMELVDRNKAIG
jgi:aminoglycoside 6'-N-acetyltransferase